MGIKEAILAAARGEYVGIDNEVEEFTISNGKFIFADGILYDSVPLSYEQILSNQWKVYG